MISRRPVPAISAVPTEDWLKVWESFADDAIGMRHLVSRSLTIDVAHTTALHGLIPRLSIPT